MIDLAKIKDYCFKREDCIKCPFEVVEGKKRDRYCMIGIEPCLWDINMIEKAYSKLEEKYGR